MVSDIWNFEKKNIPNFPWEPEILIGIWNNFSRIAVLQGWLIAILWCIVGLRIWNMRILTREQNGFVWKWILIKIANLGYTLCLDKPTPKQSGGVIDQRWILIRPQPGCTWFWWQADCNFCVTPFPTQLWWNSMSHVSLHSAGELDNCYQPLPHPNLQDLLVLRRIVFHVWRWCKAPKAGISCPLRTRGTEQSPRVSLATSGSWSKTIQIDSFPSCLSLSFPSIHPFFGARWAGRTCAGRLELQLVITLESPCGGMTWKITHLVQ